MLNIYILFFFVLSGRVMYIINNNLVEFNVFFVKGNNY